MILCSLGVSSNTLGTAGRCCISLRFLFGIYVRSSKLLCCQSNCLTFFRVLLQNTCQELPFWFSWYWLCHGSGGLLCLSSSLSSPLLIFESYIFGILSQLVLVCSISVICSQVSASARGNKELDDSTRCKCGCRALKGSVCFNSQLNWSHTVHVLDCPSLSVNLHCLQICSFLWVWHFAKLPNKFNQNSLSFCFANLMFPSSRSHSWNSFVTAALLLIYFLNCVINMHPVFLSMHGV